MIRCRGSGRGGSARSASAWPRPQHLRRRLRAGEKARRPRLMSLRRLLLSPPRRPSQRQRVWALHPRSDAGKPQMLPHSKRSMTLPLRPPPQRKRPSWQRRLRRQRRTNVRSKPSFRLPPLLLRPRLLPRHLPWLILRATATLARAPSHRYLHRLGLHPSPVRLRRTRCRCRTPVHRRVRQAPAGPQGPLFVQPARVCRTVLAQLAAVFRREAGARDKALVSRARGPSRPQRHHSGHRRFALPEPVRRARQAAGRRGREAAHHALGETRVEAEGRRASEARSIRPPSTRTSRRR